MLQYLTKSPIILKNVLTTLFFFQGFIPDTYLVLSCSITVCGARYKTRPGLSYHYNHTHREKPPDAPTGPLDVEHDSDQVLDRPSAPSSVGGGSLTPPSTPGEATMASSSGGFSELVSGARTRPLSTQGRRPGHRSPLAT